MLDLASVTSGRSILSAVGLPTPARRDEAELLDIDMDEVSRVVALVAAHDFSCGPIHVIEAVEPLPDQALVDGRRGDPDTARYRPDQRITVVVET